MAQPHTNFILWTGPKHSGKTTAAAALVDLAKARGFAVAGLLAPGVYRNGRLVGFDAVDLRTGSRASLARLDRMEAQQAGAFGFKAEGLALGAEALGLEATRDAELVVVDEFGPLEIRGDGWRRAVDTLVRSAKALVLLVVREEIIDLVKRLYPGGCPSAIPAAGPDAAETVIRMLEELDCGTRRHHLECPVFSRDLHKRCEGGKD